MTEPLRIAGFERIGPPVPGGAPIDAVMDWRGEVYVAQQGCVWVLRDNAWALAVEAVPPSFPPSRPQGHEP